MVFTENIVSIGDIIEFFKSAFSAVYQYFKTFAFRLDGGEGTWYVLLVGIPILVLVIRFLIAPLFRGALNLRSPGSDPVKSDLSDDVGSSNRVPDGIDSSGREYYF